MLIKFLRLQLPTLFLILLSAASFAQQTKLTPNADEKRAAELLRQNRFLDALPFLEKIARTNPVDGDFWANYAMAIYSRGQTLPNGADRKLERLAARAAAQKAKDLGSQHPFMRDILANVPPDGGSSDFTKNTPVNAAMLEGEAAFGRGDFAAAFVAYERAAKLDPQNYEALAFAGDTFYARKMLPEAEKWFARAVAVNPNRELAFRFWADALMLQNKPQEARDKYVEAVIAEPFTRQSWDNLMRWAEGFGGWNPKGVIPPGGKSSGEITFDESLLKTEDGTVNWRRYRQMRDLWKQQFFAKNFPKEKQYRLTLREEAAALRLVAETAKSDLQKGSIKKLDGSLAILIEISDADLLEAYALYPRSNKEISADYEEYRRVNRDKLRRFIVEYLLGAKA